MKEVKKRDTGDVISDFDLRRLDDSLENAIEVWRGAGGMQYEQIQDCC